ncbi:hypothetical protein BD408DRAFT_86297 [Parasitella parasitica]|nr:hypothetical protein BD408DRAFT_86297 [Parasitella parasitica]
MFEVVHVESKLFRNVIMKSFIPLLCLILSSSFCSRSKCLTYPIILGLIKAYVRDNDTGFHQILCKTILQCGILIEDGKHMVFLPLSHLYSIVMLRE